MTEHPSKDIVGTLGQELMGNKVALCVTGSISAYQCPELARRLMRHGAEVYTFMSPTSQNIIHPNLMEWASGNPVITELTGKIEHIALSDPDEISLVLVAPASANTINKIASGIADTAPTALVHAALGLKLPVIIVPAMHESLYKNLVLLENINKLRGIGVEFVGPKVEEGKAKIADIEEIVEAVIYRLSEKDLSDLKILVTAGPSKESIDPIRVITNRSSGKQGLALAYEARRRGAVVTLVYGGSICPPSKVKTLRVETTREMVNVTMTELESVEYDVVLAAAALADYGPEKPFETKIQSATVKELTLKLRTTPKLIDEVKRVTPETLLVAFKAEYNVSDDELIEKGYERLKSSGADLIVVNDVAREGVGFQVDTNEIFIVDKKKEVFHIPISPKKIIAREILNHVKRLLR